MPVGFQLPDNLDRLDDHELAGALAVWAGRLLVALRQEVVAKGVWGWRLGDLGDEFSNDFLLQALKAARPDDPVLSEEAADDRRRLDAERVWIIDPLDGTREFSEPGRVDWAVHVALWERGALAAGAVSLPAQDKVFATPDPEPLPPLRAPGGRPRVIVSRSRTPWVAAQVAHVIGGVMVELGSAGAKAMAVVQGDAEVYVHDGGQYEWDSAAPVVVARAAGCHTSRVDGLPLVYNQRVPYVHDFVICRPELAAPVLDALR